MPRHQFRHKPLCQRYEWVDDFLARARLPPVSQWAVRASLDALDLCRKSASASSYYLLPPYTFPAENLCWSACLFLPCPRAGLPSAPPPLPPPPALPPHSPP